MARGRCWLLLLGVGVSLHAAPPIRVSTQFQIADYTDNETHSDFFTAIFTGGSLDDDW
jgi:hypothetical protein